MRKTKVLINYRCWEPIDEKNTIAITIKGTGINIADENHKEFMDVIIHVLSSQMYAKANGIDLDNIVYNEDEILKQKIKKLDNGK